MSAAEQLEELATLTRTSEITGCSRTRIYVEIKAGRFPRPIKYAGRSLWIMSEVQAWIRRQIAECPRMGSSMGSTAQAMRKPRQ